MSHVVNFNPETDLILERELDLPAAKVWQAWTTPALYPEFYCPKPWSVKNVTLELYPGGAYNTTMVSPDGQEYPSKGAVLEAIPNKKLVFTDCFEKDFKPVNSEMQMTAIILLEEKNGKTTYTAIARHPTKESAEKHKAMGFEQGWGIVVDQLVALLKTK